MAEEPILLIVSSMETGQLIERAALRPAGYSATVVTRRDAAEAIIDESLPAAIILSDQLEDASGLEFAAALLLKHPHLPILLLPNEPSGAQLVQAIRIGFADVLTPPVRPNEVSEAVRRALQRRKKLEAWAARLSKDTTRSLKRRVESLEALQEIARKINASLDLDYVLDEVVESAVALTGAEEGSLLLLDEKTGEFYMRAGRFFDEQLSSSFRLPMQDELAGRVLQTGKPVLIDAKTPHRLKTAFLVHTLMLVPLILNERVIGILEVDNRQAGHTFNQYHLALVSTLAGYASIAIENARLYSQVESELNKLEMLLANIEEGVIVCDLQGNLVLVNAKARSFFQVEGCALAGRPPREVFQNPELLEILTHPPGKPPSRMEIALEEGQVVNAQVTPIDGVGLVVTMQDITHLKELDHIKSEFVSTVSHDLRSPLTAILGYVELIDRVGPVNAQQKEFIRRVQVSVHSITALINDLLDLGRIEAGFDARKEVVPLAPIVQYTLEAFRNRIGEKKLELVEEVPEDLPSVLGSPVRLRQMLANLVGNAVKYTSPGGKIAVSAGSEDGQVIVQVTDNGPGIPPADQPFIFDKFYRAGNIPADTPGTGLGLAIVRSIVENHLGRIWVDSTLGQGTRFTVVLPVYRP